MAAIKSYMVNTFERESKLKKNALVFISLLLISTQLNAAANGPYFSNAFWKNFDWSKVEQSVLYTDPLFQPKNNGVEVDGKVYEKYRDIQINGRDFVQSVVKHEGGNNQRTFGISLKERKFAMCEVVRRDLDKAFGKKRIFIDSSYGGVMPMRKHSWEWSVGSSLVQLECVSMGGGDKFSNVSVTFAPNDDYFKTQVSIALDCSRNISYVGDGSSEQLSPMQFIVLPEEKLLLNLDRMIIGEVSEITSSHIQFVMARDNVTMDFRVSRYDRRLTGTAKSNPGDALIGNFHGECKKIENESRAF